MSLLTASLKRGGVAAVVITHMPMHQGIINPAEEVDEFLSLQKQKLDRCVPHIYPSPPIAIVLNWMGTSIPIAYIPSLMMILGFHSNAFTAPSSTY